MVSALLADGQIGTVSSAHAIVGCSLEGRHRLWTISDIGISLRRLFGNWRATIRGTVFPFWMMSEKSESQPWGSTEVTAAEWGSLPSASHASWLRTALAFGGRRRHILTRSW